jgi:hypothetical protein
VRRVDRARLRAQVLAPFRCAPRKALSRSRPRRARTARSPACNIALVMLQVAAQRSEPRPVGPRGAPAERSAAGHESAGADRRAYRPAGSRSARDRWEAGRDPRARALPRGRRIHPAGRSAGGRDRGPLRTSREPRSSQLKEEAPARRDACAARRARHAWPSRTQRDARDIHSPCYPWPFLTILSQ